MPPLSFPNQARQHAVAALRQYLADTLDAEVGDLKAALLLDFVVSEFGPTIYNQAVADARAFLDERLADLGSVCYHAEFPSSVRRKR
ncbi:MAG: DUF2164 domain-containing protein [Gemmatimonadota bacterium]